MAASKAETDSGFVDNWQSGKSVIQCNLHMLTSEDSCDVSFRVGQQDTVVRAHRYVLISRSCVLHAMLCGPLAEKNDVKIPDVEADIFRAFLTFLYTEDCQLRPDTVTGLLYLAKKYAVGGLERLCLTYLEASLSPENACTIMEQAHCFDEKDLHQQALEVVLQNPDVCLKFSGFTDLCHQCLDKVIASEKLRVQPDVVFTAALLFGRGRMWETRKGDNSYEQTCCAW